ncbi:NADPH-dependent FMN reductase [Halocatena pleomorpha]|uniref:NADPH-dependent oxidoreductase n=1 Tax=Halocatena pleomorpha TaxID=1785090 RepID=A0A3P3R6U7_9EURY|nr:NAD(P)H-dependent oxidoreductase [Halocatena pleomorpha]RRJ28649.1 NADPH-dependent oxidoreductase [Halocatena pleomorpha]
MTSTQPRVVALCGSLRDESRTRIALKHVLAAATEAGGSTTLLDLRALELPTLNAETGGENVERLTETIAEADSVVLGTPNYHGSYSGALKNALDHCGREELADTTVGLLEVAGGKFPGTALAHLRAVCRTLHAWTLPTEVAIPNSHTLITDSGVQDQSTADRLDQLGRELVTYAGVAHVPEHSRSDPTLQTSD